MLDARYVEKIDQRQLFQGAMNGMMATLDVHSVYMAPREYRGVDEVLNQEFGGLGIRGSTVTSAQKITSHPHQGGFWTFSRFLAARTEPN